ncbi:MAG TPA: hypothetical protein VHU24_02840, partial [Solirubrobacterales bacterium]|nr:hypothetical protein [Solirubrobacterales bacterium]
TKKSKKAKASKVRKSGLRSASPIPQVNVPNIQQLIPQLSPDQSPTAPHGAPSDGTTTTPQGNQGTTTTQPSGRQDVSMNEAQMFLQFLLGGGA